MCRLYGLRATEPTKVECTLVHARNALMAQSRADRTCLSHPHGWGIATHEDHVPRVEQQAWAAYHGEHFRWAAARIHARPCWPLSVARRQVRRHPATLILSARAGGPLPTTVRFPILTVCALDRPSRSLRTTPETSWVKRTANTFFVLSLACWMTSGSARSPTLSATMLSMAEGFCRAIDADAPSLLRPTRLPKSAGLTLPSGPFGEFPLLRNYRSNRSMAVTEGYR